MPFTTIKITDEDWYNPRERDETTRRAKIKLLRGMGYYNDDGDIYERVEDPSLPDPFVCIGWDTLIRWYGWTADRVEGHDGWYLKVMTTGESNEFAV